MNEMLTGLVVAALGGAAIGAERQHSGHASGVNARFGGLRTFTMLGGVAGIAGELSLGGLMGLAITIVAAVCALIIAGYVAASRRGVDATTETAALVVVACGVLAGRHDVTLASGIIAITALLLAEKSRLHMLVDRVDDDEMKAAVRFGVMAIVILPLLPEGPYGPLGGFRPRLLWMVVLLFSGIAFTGYLARRLTHSVSGYALAGFLGGLLSSTAATFGFARLSRRESGTTRALAIGTVAASTMLFPRLAAAIVILNREVAAALLPHLVLPFLAGALSLALVRERAGAPPPHVDRPANPLQFVPALQMAFAFQGVLFLTSWVRSAFGNTGLIASGALLGIAEMDALTVSMAAAQRVGVDAEVAARAVAAGIASNSWLKLVMVAALGSSDYRRTAVPLMLVMAVCATIAAFWW